MRPLLAALLVACLQLAFAPRAWADDEAEFRAKPSAALAEKIARTALTRDQPGKAMNWIERIGSTPGVSVTQLAWAAKVRADLRWRLQDLHIAPVQLRVTPASADVVIDGMLVPFHTGMHTIWLPEGVHHLDVIAVDHATHTSSIGARVGEREVYEIALEFSKPPVIQVHMIPEGDVWLNGALLGPSSKIRYVVSSGRHLVELQAKGYKSWQQEMTLKTGDVKLLDVQLKPIVPPLDPAMARRASQIDRPLLPSEVAQKEEKAFERVKVAGTTLDRDLGAHANVDAASPESQRKARQDAEKSKTAAKVETPTESAQKSAERPERDRLFEAPKEVASRSERTEEPERVTRKETPPDDYGTVTEPAAPSSPGLSRTTKGWIYGGVGAAALGAGLAMAYLGAADAETANQLPRGAKTYADDYAAASGKAFIGYGAAGLGAVGVGVGAYYLFGNGGLGRKGKGWVVTTLGALTAAAGGWLMLDAMTLASDTDANLSPKNPEYTRRFDLAERNRWIGIGVAGAGAAIIGTGLALVFTAPSSSANQDAPAPRERPALAWQMHPLIGAGMTGMGLSLAW